MDTTRTEHGPHLAAHGRWAPLAVFFLAALACGCKASFLNRDVPGTTPLVEHSALRPTSLHVHPGTGLATPFDVNLAGKWLADAARAETAKDPACVDLYFRAALVAWQALDAMPVATSGDAAIAEANADARRVYKRSLAKLIHSGQVLGRLDPRGHLTILDGGRLQVIPVVHHGFAWKPEEFSQLLSAEGFQSGEDEKISNHFRAEGLGVSLVALRLSQEETPYYAKQHPFSATAVLQVRDVAGRRSAVLDLFNPRTCDRCLLGGVTVGMQRDLTAPFVYMTKAAPKAYLEGFLAPFDTDTKPKLVMVEPYQRGKIPVVFIHGLLSDPITWLDATNDLMAEEDISRWFQVWGFRYPTGSNLLGSAADLREKLAVARQTFDPCHEDPALDHIVLIGHSMGGLMAKLQVTQSAETLWRKAAHRPLDEVVATPELHRELQRDFFFEPAPYVTRVVFIGTPHQGSSWTRRAVGRISKNLVRAPQEEEDAYQCLMENNRHIFYSYLWKARPTSLDLLEPSSQLLAGLNELRYGRVTLHSIVGTGGMPEMGEPGDGVVPLSSARLYGVASELSLPVRHTELHHTPEAVAELARILREHARTAQAINMP